MADYLKKKMVGLYRLFARRPGNRKQKGNMQFIALRDQQKLAPNVSVLTDARKGINASVGQNRNFKQRRN